MRTFSCIAIGTGLVACVGVLAMFAGDSPRTLDAYLGSTPKLVGVISPGEWDDAASFTGVADWVPAFTKTTDPIDLSLRGWVTHDGKRIYFAFDATDDVLYGIDTPTSAEYF